MSLKITLYQNSKLSNKYINVFQDKVSLDTYLATLTYLEVYSGDDIYYTNSGSISLDNTDLTSFTSDKYNYITFKESTKIRYCFINSIQIVNSVAIINYEEDIWHNYAITNSTWNFNLINSRLYQCKTLSSFTGSTYDQTQLNAIPKKLPVDLIGQNNPEFWIYDPDADVGLPYTEECWILATISFYTLEVQGNINKRQIGNYLIGYTRYTDSPDDDQPEHASGYLWPLNNDTLEAISQLQAISSDTQVNYQDGDYHAMTPCYYEIIDVKLIPLSMGSYWFQDIIKGYPNDPNHANGLHQDATLDIRTLDWSNYSGDAYQKKSFKTHIHFMNIIQPTYNAVKSETLYPDYPDNTWWQYNGFNLDQRPQYEYEVDSSKDWIAIGNMSRIIPVEYDGKTKKVVFELCINKFGNRINMLFDNTITDVSEDYTLHIPISTQTADTTQQQKTALKTANLCGILGIVSGATNLGVKTSAMANSSYSDADIYSGKASNEMMGGFGSLVGGFTGLMSTAFALGSKNTNMYLTNRVVNYEQTAVVNCILGGIRELKMNYTNSEFVNQMIDKYGYLRDFIIDDIQYVRGTGNYVRFAQANVYGNFSQDIARKIETILENGVILN